MSAALETRMLPPAEDILDVLEPTGFKVLVYVLPEPEKTDAGVVKLEEIRAREETAGTVAQVISLGPDAYKDEKRFHGIAWCAPGDYVVMRPYSGTRFSRDGYPYQYRLINDDTVEAVIRSQPGEIKRGY
jgi:co-chaperonin GroES (HSP10)